MIGNYVDSDRLTQLKMLLKELAEGIDKKPGARDLAQLSKQYRETLREVEELEQSTASKDDELDRLLQPRWYAR